jgi:hypothetical protein
MVAAGEFVEFRQVADFRRAAELADHHDQRAVEHSGFVEVVEQR